jgi:ABC-type arginine transport system permease subunit
MTPDAVGVFTEYFGQPARLYLAMAVMLFMTLGIAWIMITIKAFKERNTDRRNRADDAYVITVILRGLALLLIITLVFYQNI